MILALFWTSTTRYPDSDPSFLEQPHNYTSEDSPEQVFLAAVNLYLFKEFRVNSGNTFVTSTTTVCAIDFTNYATHICFVFGTTTNEIRETRLVLENSGLSEVFAIYFINMKFDPVFTKLSVKMV